MSETTMTEANNLSAKDRGRTAERLASMAHDTIDRVADGAARAENEVREGAAKLADKARESEERVIESADAGLKAARQYVRENPILSAGIAFAAGLVMSGLLRR
jgi:ElaB/YqjD/DUF883 family membrane-anchored ribosome-binding protein